MYIKIIEGLEKLKTGGTFDETASITGLKPQQVWKRYSEMEKLELIFNVGTTRPGTSGRACSVWQLCPPVKAKPLLPVQTDLFTQQTAP